MKKHNTMKVVLLVVTALWLVSAIFLPDKDWGVLVKVGLSLVELFLILFGLKEKDNALKAVLVTTVVLMVLTWILPAAYYSGEYIDQGRVQMGLFDLFNYPLSVTLPYFGYLVLFVVAVGGFYGILYKIPAYRSFLDKIAAICKGKEAIALSAMMFIITVLTSVFGMQLALMVFFPMLASVILLMGYDKIVVALTLVGSTMIGVAGTTYGYSNTGLLNSVLGLGMSDNVLVKTVIFLVGLVLLVFNTLMYAKRANVASKAQKTVVQAEVAEKVVEEETEEVVVEKEKPVAKKNTAKGAGKSAGKGANSTKGTAKKSTGAKKGSSSSKSSRKDIKAAAKDEEVIVVKESLVNDSVDHYVPAVVYSKHKIWPIVVAFILLFVITILAFAPWSTVFGVEAFTEATEAVNEFELFGFPIFEKLFGSFATFGEWSVSDLIIVMAFIITLLTVIYKVKVNDVFEGLANGAKKALAPAFVVLLVYTCLVLTTYHPYQQAVYKAVLGLTKGFNIVTATITGILTSLFNQDPAYAFQAAVPYFAGIVTDTNLYPVAGILFQSIYGVSMLFVPTSLVLMTVLSYLGISYKEWMKSIWKLLVELFVVLLIVFAILVLV